ncbi:MAG TPA: hypothetical protein PKZ26_10635, partial [Anaerolineaceae bacterium]|nr:hypothetical protein [Anaerolineaceae bacterium]
MTKSLISTPVTGFENETANWTTDKFVGLVLPSAIDKTTGMVISYVTELFVVLLARFELPARSCTTPAATPVPTSEHRA